ncbi:hypothetical protein PNA2_0691 [Pyrococcus sp. NA2]|uniref:AAA family ATPase n=1 Tax=Pyrococcus sp. (strain NA2) TaxID=342949 RepID=UPI000209AD43|nr:ATP/GTP-binding protein [Pyrococcus sp. NA2]AEC51607.1 hypothetical protein PNA2_0691 [Pyrococcus sp. NA2]
MADREGEEMIRVITIEGFRGIKRLELSELGQVNVIVGKNNSGKSTVLEALALTLGRENFINVLSEVVIWRGWYGGQSIDDLFYMDGNSFRITTNEARLEALKKDSIVEFRFGDNSIKIDKLSFNARAPSMPFFLKGNFEFLTPLTFRRFGYVESLYSYAYERRVIRESINILNEAYPEVEGFSPLLKEGRWILYVETSHGVYPYYLMGEGFKCAIVIAFLSALLKNGVLLIDSAEAFHHPGSLRVIAKTLIKGVIENDLQVFLTTHSLELLDLILELGRGVEGRVIHMKSVNGEISAKSIDFEHANELRESIGLDLRGA